MSNYGTNMGKNNSYNGDTKIKNKTVIKKGRTIVSISIIITVIVVVSLLVKNNQKDNILGSWTNEDGDRIEFLSDGTIDEGSGSSLNADTYEILDEGYLKWGKYDGSWIEYKYTYWKVKLDGNTLTLTLKNNPDYILVFTKVKK